MRWERRSREESAMKKSEVIRHSRRKCRKRVEGAGVKARALVEFGGINGITALFDGIGKAFGDGRKIFGFAVQIRIVRYNAGLVIDLNVPIPGNRFFLGPEQLPGGDLVSLHGAAFVFCFSIFQA